MTTGFAAEKVELTMRRRMVHHFITQTFKTVGLICFVTYWLQRVDQHFTWVFLASSILLIWLSVAWVCSILDFLMNDEGA